MDIMIFFTNDSLKCIIESFQSIQSNIDQFNNSNRGSDINTQVYKINESQFENIDYKDQFIKIE